MSKPEFTVAKAARMTMALRSEAELLRRSGEGQAAVRLEAAINECPAESLARLYDLIRGFND